MHLSSGFMNDTEIRKARSRNEIAICPYNKDNLTPVGYNLSFSRFIVSLRKKAFIKLHYKKETAEWYFFLKPNETVLVLTREAIWVSKFIGGSFHSKVSLVTEGLGHVSTTLDPGWQGQLLVPINNPTRDSVRIVVAEDKGGGIKYKTFLTMMLFRSETPSFNKADNKQARIELLENILEKRKRNANAIHLKNIIDEIKNKHGYPELTHDLNDPENRRAHIIEFEKYHGKMLSNMDNAFNRINSFSRYTYNKSAAIFVGGGLLVICALIAASVFGFRAEGGIYKEYVSIVISIVVPFIILALGYIKDKFI